MGGEERKGEEPEKEQSETALLLPLMLLAAVNSRAHREEKSMTDEYTTHLKTTLYNGCNHWFCEGDERDLTLGHAPCVVIR